MKKKVLVTALLVLCLALIGYGTVAYFTADGTARNVITSGKISITLDETAVDATGAVSEFKDVQGVMPGAEISKIVQVTNTGANDAWVRISVDKRIELADGVTGDPDTDLVTMDLDNEHWTLKEDPDGHSYYYYNVALQPGAQTEPLFTTVTFDTSMGNMYQGSVAYIDVYAAAVQTAHNGTTAMEAAGWPTAE